MEPITPTALLLRFMLSAICKPSNSLQHLEVEREESERPRERGAEGVDTGQHCVSWIVVYRVGLLLSALGPCVVGVPLLLPQITRKGPRLSS